MKKLRIAALGTLGVAAVAATTLAGDFWQRTHTDWHRNNMWPQPFIQADRAAVCEPFAIQVNNGWRLQNTVGDAYFDPATQELTLAGQHKVRWIVQQAPAHRRAVFVLVNEDQEVTNHRVASVQQAAQRYTIKGTPPEVLLTDRDVSFGSGDYYDAVDRAMKSSVPTPRLPARGSSGAAGASAGGAGAAGAAGS
jgi:hypothetical protein